MACGGIASPLQLTAGAGMLQNQGLGVNSALTSNLSSFNGLAVTNQFSSVVSGATGVLGSGTLSSLRTLGAGTFPALTNAIPSSFVPALTTIATGGVATGGFTGLIASTAAGLTGAGDISQLAQIYSSASAYAGVANQFINSATNVGALSTTFGPLSGGMDSLITGSVSQVSEAFGSFGGDLRNLGNAIDLSNLSNLGDPSALVRQVATTGGITPGLETALRQSGVSTATLGSFSDANFPGLSDSANKQLYSAMTNITGNELAQVKSVLGVSTPGINSMADLLNPSKAFPSSSGTLTMPTPDGLRGIYTASGAVNTNLERFLIDPNAPEYTGDDPIVRARLGLPPLDQTRTLTT